MRSFPVTDRPFGRTARRAAGALFVVSDHSLDLATALGQLPGVDVTGSATSAERAVGVLANPAYAADVVVAAGDGGLDLCRRLAVLRPALRCVVLSPSADVASVTRALSAGAAGYLVSDVPADSLAAAVRAAADGRLFVDPRVARATPLQRGVHHGTLSATEAEVLRLVADGLSNAEIGSAINVAPSTAKARVSRVLTKLGARSRAEAVAIAVRSGAL